MPQLVSLLSSPEPKIRAAAAEALGKVHEGTDEVMAALRKAALDKDPMVQEEARKALLEFVEPPAGQKGSSVEPLEKATDDEDPEIRERAGKALESLKE